MITIVCLEFEKALLERKEVYLEHIKEEEESVIGGILNE